MRVRVRVRVRVRACVRKDGVIELEGLRVGGLLFGGALAFQNWTEARWTFFWVCPWFYLVRHWRSVRCGNTREGRDLVVELTFLCVFFLSCCFLEGGVLWDLFCFFFIFPKKQKHVVTKEHA